MAALILTGTAGPPERAPAVTLVAVGDIQLGRGVGRAIARSGPDYPFEHVAPLVRQADLAIFNLECAISEDGIPIEKRYSFKAAPIAAAGLARAGFDVAILANNHSVDCGRRVLPETLSVLRSHNISPVGAGRSAAEAAAPLIVERSGLRIAVLARTFVLPDGVIYREDVPTIAVYDPDRIEQDVRAAARQADIVVVSLHWGIEYARQPQESQRRIARAAGRIDMSASAPNKFKRRLVEEVGADLVIGHHTHTPQPIERYRNGLIAYSLGNFVFDSHAEGGRRGLLLQCRVGADGVEDHEAIPIRIERAQPHPARE